MVARRPVSRFCRLRFGRYDLVWVHLGFVLGVINVIPTDFLPSERIRKLDQHQGFVKGVCWDPVGEFLATQSDDRTVKIWKTTDWSPEAEITKPFEDSPGSTFFRRLRYMFQNLTCPG